MKTLALVFGIALAGASAMAQSNDTLGVGATIGEPTGFNLKYWLDGSHAVDGGIAWSMTENESLHLHSDYLFHKFDALHPPELERAATYYYGIGARIKFKDSDGNGRNEDDDLVGIRVPLGFVYRFQTSPFDIFLEFVPILDVIPETDFDIAVAVGARYYFK